MRIIGSTMLALLCVGAVACQLSLPPPMARVRRGPGFAPAPTKILALPAVCEAESEGICLVAHQKAVDVTTRMSLEFVGYRLVDSELVNIYLRERVERIRTTTAESYGVIRDQETRSVEVAGVGWDQATVEERQRVLGEMGVDGFLASRIVMGPMKNVEGQRTVEIHLVVTRVHDNALVWRSRCAVETGQYHSIDQAVDLAARCALEGANLLKG